MAAAQARARAADPAADLPAGRELGARGVVLALEMGQAAEVAQARAPGQEIAAAVQRGSGEVDRAAAALAPAEAPVAPAVVMRREQVAPAQAQARARAADPAAEAPAREDLPPVVAAGRVQAEVLVVAPAPETVLKAAADLATRKPVVAMQQLSIETPTIAHATSAPAGTTTAPKTPGYPAAGRGTMAMRKQARPRLTRGYGFLFCFSF